MTEFTCAMCGNLFTSDIPGEVARKEYVDTFGPVETAADTLVVVCDDCYKSIFPEVIN
jgi:hypothetical protein